MSMDKQFYNSGEAVLVVDEPGLKAIKVKSPHAAFYFMYGEDAYNKNIEDFHWSNRPVRNQCYVILKAGYDNMTLFFDKGKALCEGELLDLDKPFRDDLFNKLKLNEYELADMIIENPSCVRCIPNPTDDFLLHVLRRNATVLKYIRTPTKAMIETAIRTNPLASEWIFPIELTEDLSKLTEMSTFHKVYTKTLGK